MVGRLAQAPDHAPGSSVLASGVVHADCVRLRTPQRDGMVGTAYGRQLSDFGYTLKRGE